MLKKTVYFRTQDDLDKFNAIGNKAQWLHEQLAHSKIGVPMFDGKPLNTPEGKQAEKDYWDTHEPTITPAEETA